MRRSHVKAVFVKELRETLRDRRSMIVMFGIPLILYPLITLAVAGLGLSRQKKLADQVDLVAVVNAQAAPELLARLKADKQLKIYDAPDPRQALADRRIDGVLFVPDQAQTDALAAKKVQFQLMIDRSRTESAMVELRLGAILDDYERWLIEQRVTREIAAQLESHGISPPAPVAATTSSATARSTIAIFTPLERRVQDIASGGQRLGKLLSLMLPNILLLTGMLGAFFPAINATTTERENGTLETLLVSPVTRAELLLAKGALVLISSVATAGLNLISMSLVLWRTFSMIDNPALKDLTISPLALALTFLAVIPSLIFFSAMVLSVGLFARNFREANSYATPVMLLPLISVAISIAEPSISTALLVTPVASTTLIIREVLTGHVEAGAFLLAFISSCVYAALMVSAASRLFTNEQLVNPAWEPFSLAGLRRGLTRLTPRLPAIDEALVLFAITILLLFYVSPQFVHYGLLPTVYGNQLLLILVPTLIAAWIGHWRRRDTFALRPAHKLALLGALALGVGLAPIASILSRLQDRIWPRDLEQARALAEMFVRALSDHPIITIVSIALLAGVCEELLYRGAIQSALRRRFSPFWAAAIGGLLFAAAHLDLHGLPIRLALGTIFGLILIRTGSIYPAIIAHALYDAAQLSTALYYLRQSGWQTKSALLDGRTLWMPTDWVLLPLGAILTALGVWALLRSPRVPAPMPEHSDIPRAEKANRASDLADARTGSSLV